MASNYQKPRLKLGEIVLLLDEDYYDVDVIDATGNVVFAGEVGKLRNATNIAAWKGIQEKYVNKLTFDEYGEYVIYLEAEERAEVNGAESKE